MVDIIRTPLRGLVYSGQIDPMEHNGYNGNRSGTPEGGVELCKEAPYSAWILSIDGLTRGRIVEFSS